MELVGQLEINSCTEQTR